MAADEIKEKPPARANANPMRAQNMRALHFVLCLHAIA